MSGVGLCGRVVDLRHRLQQHARRITDAIRLAHASRSMTENRVLHVERPVGGRERAGFLTPRTIERRAASENPLRATTINDCAKLGTALGGTPTIVERLPRWLMSLQNERSSCAIDSAPRLAEQRLHELIVRVRPE